MEPINWDAIVLETFRRREEEKLTQLRHATLANVGIPTMAAFERGELSLSLVKAFDILRVVGLVDDFSGKLLSFKERQLDLKRNKQRLIESVRISQRINDLKKEIEMLQESLKDYE